MSDKQSDKVAEWTKLIVEEKAVTLTGFLEAKRKDLLADSPDTREEALSEIVAVVCSLPNEFLDSDQVALLLEFFLGRVETSALAGGSVISGIHHLILKCVNLPEQFELTVIRFMFKEGNVQSWPQKERRKQYDILQWLLKNRLKVLQAIGIDFVATFIKTVSGERDPRGLVMVFSMFVNVCSNFDLGPFSEEMFETIACYFPVEFKPQPSDTITRSLLATSCASCLVASPSFAPFCYMLIDEKFNEEECTDEQKDDVCALLALACEKFPPNAISAYLNEMLGGIRMVALNPKNRGEMSEFVEPALTELIKAVQKISKQDLVNDVKVADSLIDNLEPFVLQAEMGLCGKALSLLKITVQTSSEAAAKKVLDQTIAWLVTLVQGDSVNTAANRADIMRESLVFLVEWIRLAAGQVENPAFETSLRTFESSVFASIDVAREIVANEAVVATYQCAKAYVNLKSEELTLQIKELLLNELKTIVVDEQFQSQQELITELSVHDYSTLLDVIDSIPADQWNHQKLIPIFCSAVSNEISWEKFGSYIRKAFAERINKGEAVDTIVTDCVAYVAMCKRNQKNGDLLQKNVDLFFEILNQASGNCTELQCQTLSASFQEIALLLPTTRHDLLMSSIANRWRSVHSNPVKSDVDRLEKLFALAFLQTTSKEHLAEFSKSQFLNIGLRHQILLAAVNRGACEPHEDASSDIRACFVSVKALLLSSTRQGLELFQKLILQILSSSSSNSSDVATNFAYLLDFDRLDSQPEMCRYVTGSPLWRQRIFYMLVPVYKKLFEEQTEDGQRVLITFLPTLLEFARSLGTVQVKDQFAMLLPLLLSSLSDSGPVSPAVLRAVPSFLAIAEAIEPVNIIVVVNRLCDVVKQDDSTLICLQDCLEGLSLLARRQPARSLQPLISHVVGSLNRLLGHKKRTIRQKSAQVKNLWEMLTTK